MNRKLLDALYIELYNAKNDVNYLEKTNIFPLCKCCQRSADEARHSAKYSAAKARVCFADRIITLVMEEK